jgi:protein-arginine kinase activator protein McsA
LKLKRELEITVGREDFEKAIEIRVSPKIDIRVIIYSRIN